MFPPADIESMSEAQIKSTQEAMQQRICDSNKGRALLKMMGWAGGGLGKEEQGGAAFCMRIIYTR